MWCQHTTHTTHNTQHTTNNNQQTPTQQTTDNNQHTAHTTQHTATNKQHTTHNKQHTTHNKQHGPNILYKQHNLLNNVDPQIFKTIWTHNLLHTMGPQSFKPSVAHCPSVGLCADSPAEEKKEKKDTHTHTCQKDLSESDGARTSNTTTQRDTS